MDTLISILEFLDTKMEVPSLYGWYHITWLIITVLAAVILCRFCKTGDDRGPRRVVAITTAIVILLEIYKQINYTFTVSEGTIVTDYLWYAFPFQFCSTPMYVGLLASVLKKGKVRDALYAYLATYGMFGGLCVMIYPGDVYISTAGINFQSMVCHSTMVAVGIYLFYSGAVKVSHKTILKAMAVFACAVGIACALNEHLYAVGLEETFNMFYISPHYEGTLPVYSLVQKVVPYPWCLVIYIAVFSLAAYVILLCAMLCKKLFSRKKSAPLPVSGEETAKESVTASV